MDRKIFTFTLIAAIVLFLDQLTKTLIKRFAPSWDSNFLSIHYTTNTGAAFSMLQGKNLLLVFLSVIVLAAIIYEIFFRRNKVKIGIIYFSALLFGGALGNLADRLIYGFVVDFIDFKFWPAFNVADIAITIGVFGLIILLWKE